MRSPRRSRVTYTTRLAWLACVIFAWLCVCPSAQAGSSVVVGGGEGLAGWVWWVRPAVAQREGREQLWLSAARLDVSGEAVPRPGAWSAGDTASTLRPVAKVNGRVRPWAVSASPDGRTVWLAFEAGADAGWPVASWTLRDGGAAGLAVDSAVAPSLPAGGRVRALAVSGGGPWVLWRGEHGRVADEAEQPEPVDEAAAEFKRRVIILKLPPKPTRQREGSDDTDGQASSADAGESTSETEAAEAVEGSHPLSTDASSADGAADAAPRDVLFRLRGQRWEAVPLPTDWPAEASVALLPGGEAVGQPPALVARFGDSIGVWRCGRLEEDTREHETAEASDVAEPRWRADIVPFPGRRTWHALSAGQQVLIAAETDEVESADAGTNAGKPYVPRYTLWVIRNGEAVRLGRLPRLALPPVDGDDAPPFPMHTTVLGVGQAAAQVTLPDLADAGAATRQDVPPGSVAAMDLTGRLLVEDVELPVQDRQRRGPPPGQTLLMAVLMASTVVMLMFWRRDPTGQSFKLPEGTAVAALDRRALAGTIDLAVGFAVAWGLYDLTPAEVLERWPGRSATLPWSALVPALVCIAAVVVHTAVGEAFTGRSLGKALTGLRVVDRHGRPATGWRGLVRCLLKVLDLVAYLLLVLVVVSPLRQRMGDLVAGTAVVMNASPADDRDKPTG